jgi:Holliday junction resolvase RusA-like endonuclease
MKALTWQRTRGAGNRRFMSPKLRLYYYEMYEALTKTGLQPLDTEKEYAILVKFYFRDKRHRDTDNLIKGIGDLGQPSKWAKPMEKLVMPDLWDDKQFADVHGIRYRGAGRDAIEITIGEWDETKPETTD